MNRIIIELKNDWVQFNPFNKRIKWNWYSFHFIHLYFEYDKMHEGIEFWCYILGFGIYIRYNFPASDAIFKKYEEDIYE